MDVSQQFLIRTLSEHQQQTLHALGVLSESAVNYEIMDANLTITPILCGRDVVDCLCSLPRGFGSRDQGGC